MTPAVAKRLCAAVFLTVFFGLPGLAPGDVEAVERKNLPFKVIPKKRIPKQKKYYQAPAFNKHSRKNRRLVIDARRKKRNLRRTGSAYEDDIR